MAEDRTRIDGVLSAAVGGAAASSPPRLDTTRRVADVTPPTGSIPGGDDSAVEIDGDEDARSLYTVGSITP